MPKTCNKNAEVTVSVGGRPLSGYVDTVREGPFQTDSIRGERGGW